MRSHRPDHPRVGQEGCRRGPVRPQRPAHRRPHGPGPHRPEHLARRPRPLRRRARQRHLAPALTAHLSPTASCTCDRPFESDSRSAGEGAACEPDRSATAAPSRPTRRLCSPALAEAAGSGPRPSKQSGNSSGPQALSPRPAGARQPPPSPDAINRPNQLPLIEPAQVPCGQAAQPDGEIAQYDSGFPLVMLSVRCGLFRESAQLPELAMTARNAR
jgi:hypothetical protein